MMLFPTKLMFSSKGSSHLWLNLVQVHSCGITWGHPQNVTDNSFFFSPDQTNRLIKICLKCSWGFNRELSVTCSLTESENYWTLSLIAVLVSWRDPNANVVLCKVQYLNLFCRVFSLCCLSAFLWPQLLFSPPLGSSRSNYISFFFPFGPSLEVTFSLFLN